MLGTSNEEETLYLLLESLNFGRENKELVTRKINKTLANYDQCYTRKKRSNRKNSHEVLYKGQPEKASLGREDFS